MNLTVQEERIFPVVEKKSKRIKKIKAWYCPKNHQMGVLYYRFTSRGSLGVIPKMFYCPICMMLYSAEPKEIKLK